jgi:[ribosomal protein S18]-alanine N-acetyltransferase
MDFMTDLHAGFVLQSMTEANVPEVAAIERATQPTPWSEQVFRDCLSSCYDCRVICRDNQLVGFVVLSSVLDEVHLLNVAVAPAMQRRGIAWAALKQVLADYQGKDMRYLYLEVRESNTGAIALYQHLGFDSTGRRRQYYRTASGREDAILMMRALNPAT